MESNRPDPANNSTQRLQIFFFFWRNEKDTSVYRITLVSDFRVCFTVFVKSARAWLVLFRLIRTLPRAGIAGLWFSHPSISFSCKIGQEASETSRRGQIYIDGEKYFHHQIFPLSGKKTRERRAFRPSTVSVTRIRVV